MIGICINYKNYNYGGLLQAFATTKVLEKMNVDYEIIRYSKKIGVLKKISYIPRIFNKILMNDKKENFKKKIGLKRNPEFKANNDIRNAAFSNFINNNFSKFSLLYPSYNDLKRNSGKYSIVLTGSDQLWSPAGLPTNFYNLMFCDRSVKRVSYASSFGVGYIPWYQKRRTKKYLNQMDYISMRENKGATIVEELTGKKVPVVCDPVFLLNKFEWDELIPNEKKFDFDYIFAYFLGDNEEYRNEITKFAKEKNLKIVTLRHLDQFIPGQEQFGDYYPYNVSPIDFLNLIRNAKFVFTDSFHGSVFSIIYEKKFLSFNRYSNKSKVSKNSRIDTLMTNLGIDRRYKTIESVTDDIDYNLVNEKLYKIIVDSKKYLEMILEK